MADKRSVDSGDGRLYDCKGIQGVGRAGGLVQLGSAVGRMQGLISRPFVKQYTRWLIPALVVGGVLAASLLFQPARLLGVGASFSYVTTVCSSANITSGPASPQSPGTSVTLTGSSTGCSTPEYRFWLLAPGAATWVVQNSYSPTTTFVWSTAGAAPGVWQIGVWARQVGSASSYQAYSIHTYTLTVPYCTSADITAAPASPQLAATSVTFTGTAAGCSTAQYEFWELPAGSSTWAAVRAYGAGNTFVWDTTGLANGPYRFGIWAREVGSGNAYDTFAIMTFWIDP